MVYYSRMFIQESLFTCFTLAFVVALGAWRREADLRGPRWRASRQAWRSRPKKHRLSCCRPRSRPARSRGRHCFGMRRPPDDRRSQFLSACGVDGSRRAVLLVVSRRAGGPPRSVSRSRSVPRPRHRSGEPRTPVALLSRPARVLLIRRPHVERGARPRTGCRRRGDLVGPARSRRDQNAPSGHAISPATSPPPLRFSRPFGTRLRGTCCRST